MNWEGDAELDDLDSVRTEDLSCESGKEELREKRAERAKQLEKTQASYLDFK